MRAFVLFGIRQIVFSVGGGFSQGKVAVLSNAVVGALKNDASAGKKYLIAGQNTTIYDFFKAYKEASGARTLLMPIPVGTGLFADCSLATREIGFANRPFVEGWREVIATDAQVKQLSS